jgi:hypothetical protein
MKKTLLTMTIVLLVTALFGQKYIINGYIKDNENGEGLIGANVIIGGTSSGTVTNVYGFYSLSLPAGSYTLVYSYMGYNTIEKPLVLESDLTISVELIPTSEQIDEVVVSAESKMIWPMTIRIRARLLHELICAAVKQPAVPHGPFAPVAIARVLRFRRSVFAMSTSRIAVSSS